MGKVKEIIHTKAFTKKFASYELNDLFYRLKRDGEFDDFVPKDKKKSAESSHGKPHVGKKEEKDWAEMSEEEFEEDSEERGKTGRSGKLLNKKGEEIPW